MKKLLIHILIMFFLVSCKTKLKIYDIHEPCNDADLYKNFYLKDQSRSFENLKGTWVWTNSNDTLTLKIKPDYKKEFKSSSINYENAYYDSSIINVKYVRNGSVIFDNLDKNVINSCLIARTFKIQTNIFYLQNACLQNFDYSYLIFLNDNNGLSLLSPYAGKEKVLMKEESKYEIVIPNSIILDRVIE